MLLKKKKIRKISVKYLSFGLKTKSGINFYGKKTLKTRCSRRSKRKFRIIDFYRDYYNIPAIVLDVQYDPNRTAFIALICYKNGILSYILSVHGLKKNDFLNVSYQQLGSVKTLKEFSFGSYVSSVELYKNFGAKLGRSAGCFCLILNKINNKVIVRLPSGEERLLDYNNKAVLGITSNINHKFLKLKKAGDNILLGKKPKVRGVAQNSVDHPHGGGRGKTSKLVIPTNFTRRFLKWSSTASNKMFFNKKFILKSRKWKK